MLNLFLPLKILCSIERSNNLYASLTASNVILTKQIIKIAYIKAATLSDHLIQISLITPILFKNHGMMHNLH